MWNVRIACNDKSVLDFERFKQNPFFEVFNEDNPKELKGAWKCKGEAGARQVPFIGFYQDGKLTKAFYSEDKSATLNNLLNYLDDYIKNNAKEGHISVTKIEGNESTFKLGTTHSGYTNNFIEGVGCYMENDSEYFHTSIITSIDWKNNTFNTLNSKYKFEFHDN